MREFNEVASAASVERAMAALRANGIEAELVPDGGAARSRVLELVPPGAQVMLGTSRTLELTGLVSELEESGRYDAVRPTVRALDRATQSDQIRRLRSAPDVVVGSVHAVTERGEVVIASASGSQMAPYVYGARTVIWVVGTQKVVPDLDAGMRRVMEYALPLEENRAQQAYGRGSGANKVLIISREIRPNRIRLIFVSESIGF